LTLEKISDHEPYSNEINVHGDTKSLLESFSKLKPSFVSALVEAVCEGDLLIVVPCQQTDLVAGKVWW